MKKFLFTALMVLSTAVLFAQNQKVQSAILYHRHGELDKALEAIEAAVKHPKTMESAKTWYYRGEIFLALDGNEAHGSLAEDAPVSAMESYMRSVELDERKDYSDDAERKVKSLQAKIYNRGVERYIDKAYLKAMEDFERLLAFNPEDTSLLFNAALTAEKLNQSDKAIGYFDALLAVDYKKPAIYQTLAQLMKEANDTTKAIEYLSMGRKEFPNEVGLVIDELNIYLLQGRNQEVIKNLEDAIKLDGTNATLYFALGTAHDQLKNQEKAADNYKKAIEFKADYFDANYNLGAMYFNKAAELSNEANKIPFNQQKKYEEAIKKVKEEFLKAQPYLERAHEIDPQDINTLVSLQQMYAQLKMDEKVKEMKQKRESIQK